MSILQAVAIADVLLFYPGESLRDQMRLWQRRHSEWQIEASFERSLPKIRNRLGNALAVLVDATADPSLAADAFLQAVARLGTEAVCIYSEKSHHDLEMFVRMRGSLYLLGPLTPPQWDELLERRLSLRDRQTVAGLERCLWDRGWNWPRSHKLDAQTSARHPRHSMPDFS